MSVSCSGIGVSNGIAIGEAHLLQRGRPDIVPRFIETDQISDEVDRFRQAVAGARRQLKAIRDKIAQNTRSDIVAFIDTHLLMLTDEALVEAPISTIREKQYAAEWALQVQRDALVRVFDEMEDDYLRTRKDDVEHVVDQIQKNLTLVDEDDLHHLEGKIIVAQDLTPADTILMRHQGVAAFVTEYGGPMSHTAILARSLGIPAVVGVHEATHNIQDTENLIVDGHQGIVIINAEDATLSQYLEKKDADLQHAESLRRLIDQPAQTIDGHTVQLLANIELPEDIETTPNLKANGVGLYRTEFLYMNRNDVPNEEEHFRAYRQVVNGLGGIPVTIRTLDLGADKQIDGCNDSDTPVCNPALGLRAIRLCLKEPQLFLPQLRAILRASAYGPIRIMIPMLSTLHEVKELRQMVEDVMYSLKRDGIAFDADIPIGGMIEIPAAALAAESFARELDFLSIGTNDLIQYTLAIDRVDDEVNYLFDPLHPSVLRLIQMVIDAGRNNNIPVSMCGEMAGDPRYIPLLLGMGLQEFSMQPGALLEAKHIFRNINAGELAERVTPLMQQLDTPETAEKLLQISALTS
ncbi:phosphoenolpyruvate--protein phosphotransferase [Solemya velesiana gill symbiont]|uniref:Phosphoenolpyruvate-protein phosphotransferase n=1 Tax=Solemya velesiana gill symbiont TaxID=1918948 RepID=A0A1T2KVA5_9GAMM|nr:phosphoenolpyruvate--protein phosphotransferase [Solemya velesiana gill symbiont]OOZ36779.1 phosphoenolpyruvate--protein phosphotransferase [Solemya velesiana gill symbiont]